MGMRKRFNEAGDVIGVHNMIFDNIPDDYKIRKVLLNDKVYDLSYLGVMKHLRDNQVSEEFLDDKFYSSQVISHMAFDYLDSARLLYKGVLKDREDRDVVSTYLIPCAYLCKHSIELKLKECMIEKGNTELKGHSVLEIWKRLDEMTIPHTSEIQCFIEEVEKIDSNEMALRYGISKSLSPLQEKFKFDIDSLIENTMFLFNVLDEYVICKYRYNK